MKFPFVSGTHNVAPLSTVMVLAAGSTVHLPRDARDRLLAADGQLLALSTVRVLSRPLRHES